MEELVKNLDWLIPKNLKMVNIDWEKERKRLPERYVACAYRGLLDFHTYPSTKHNEIAQQETRDSKTYELTKRKAQGMLHRLPGKPVQVAHGGDGKLDERTGLPKDTVGKSVIGEIVQGWLENNDEDLYTEIKLDNQDEASLMWNYLLHHSKVNRGVSINTGSTYTESFPFELSLVDTGVRPGTGITDVITADGKRIKFDLYKLPTDPVEVITPPPSPSVPDSDTKMQQQQPTAPANIPPRDLTTGRFVAAGNVTGEAASQMSAHLQQELQARQMAMAQQYSNPTNVPGTFTKPMAPNPNYQNSQSSYPIDQDFTGMPHTNMLGGVMHDIAIDQHREYLIKQQQQRQLAEVNQSFMKTPATAIPQAENYTPPNPPHMQNPLFEQQIQALQAQQQKLEATLTAHAQLQQKQSEAQAAAAQAQKQSTEGSSVFAKTVGYDHDGAVKDTKMADASDTSMDTSSEESGSALDEWREKASEKEVTKVRETAMKKLLAGNANKLTKKESMVLGEDAITNKEQLKKKEGDHQKLKDTIVSALMSLKPETATENDAIENIKKSNNYDEIMHYKDIVCAAAGARNAAKETRLQMMDNYNLQQLEAKRRRLQNDNPVSNHLNSLNQRYAALNNTSDNQPSTTMMTPQSYNNTGYDPRTASYGGDYAPTSSPQPTPQVKQEQPQSHQRSYQPPPQQQHSNGPTMPSYLRYLAEYDQSKQYYHAVKNHQEPPPLRDYGYQPRSGDLVLAPAGNYHAGGAKGTKRGNTGEEVIQEEPEHYDPKMNTRNDEDFMHRFVLPDATRQSFLENGYKQAWASEHGYALDNFPMRKIMPTVADKISMAYAQEQLKEQIALMQKQSGTMNSNNSQQQQQQYNPRAMQRNINRY